MKALGCWLMLVGSLRLASVWFGFFDIWALRRAVFSQTTMTEIHGRTFGNTLSTTPWPFKISQLLVSLRARR
nr:ergosterol biosynthetic protein 28 [Tanacetum cinerariifolium]